MECRDETFRYRSPPTDLLVVPRRRARAPGRGPSASAARVHGPVQVRAGDAAYARRYAIWGRELETLEGLDRADRGERRSATSTARCARSPGTRTSWPPTRRATSATGTRACTRCARAATTSACRYPGTGEAEWRGLLDRGAHAARHQPQAGLAGELEQHPVDGLDDGRRARRASARPARSTARRGSMRHVRELGARRRRSRAPSDVDPPRRHDRPAAPAGRPRLRARARGARRGRAARRCSTRCCAWDGSYHRRRRATAPSTRASRSGSSSRTRPSAIALERLAGPRERGEGPRRRHRLVARVRHLQRRGVRAADARRRAATARAAEATFATLAEKFGTERRREVARAAPAVRGQRPGRGVGAGELPVLRPRDLGAAHRAARALATPIAAHRKGPARAGPFP